MVSLALMFLSLGRGAVFFVRPGVLGRFLCAVRVCRIGCTRAHMTFWNTLRISVVAVPSRLFRRERCASLAVRFENRVKRLRFGVSFHF